MTASATDTDTETGTGTSAPLAASPTCFTTLRSLVYQFLLSALDKPSPNQHAHLRGAAFRDSLALLCGQFDVVPPRGPFVPDSYADYEARYLSTFEVGLPEAPIVLLASHHVRHEPAPRVVHEHVLYYKHFDCAPMEETGEAADHLLNELRFLVHLDQLRELNPAGADSVDRARRDFLDRHPLRWLPRAATLATERRVAEFYRVLLALLVAVVQEDRGLCDGLDAPGPAARSS